MAERHRRAGKARVARVNPAKRQHQQAEVVRLRSEGRSFREIAAALAIPLHTAHDVWAAYWKEERPAIAAVAEEYRAEQTARLERLRDTAIGMATDATLHIQKKNPDESVMELEQFEKFVKCAKVAKDCMDSLARLHGINKPVEVNVNAGTLDLATFAALAAKHA